MHPYHEQGLYSGFGASLTKTVKALIIINVVLFILMHLAPGFGWLGLFALVPGYVFAKFRLWQLFTYMFLHAGLGHLVINMLMLWFFGPAIENAWGRRQFLFYYFFTGIGAGLCSWITSPASTIPVIGASGAIFGILVAYAMMFPETIILLLFIFPMKIRHAILLLAGINLLGAVSSAPGEGGIAYFAHLGGGLFGYLYLRSEWLGRKISYFSGSVSNLRLRRRQKRASKRQMTQEELDRQVDAILDKVSKYGMASLTKKERKILELKSKR
ncbi:MAG: rhomboid family intramembrane serine protease [Candidatus Omnitrophota bacterium]|nr:MAG: rhomboid family intramembrane serine protease [Candidatus Omnitrophota bacterium]